MKSFRHFCKQITKKRIYNKISKFLLRNTPLIIIIVLLFWITRCESIDRFYRPNLPEKLCAIGIIDIDDSTLRHITFEKSFQSEFTGKINDPLRNFSFSISSKNEELFNYYSVSPINGPIGFEIPASAEFRSGEIYYLNAREDSTLPILAATSTPSSPSEPQIISVNRGIITTGISVCLGNNTYKLITIEFSFLNNPEHDSYYAITTDMIRLNYLDPLSGIYEFNHMQFDINGCNTPGFFAPMPGITQLQNSCVNNSPELIEVVYSPYFIEGNRIPGGKCTIVISTIFHDDALMWKRRRLLKIKVLSIPKDFFLYEKSLYSYNRNSHDPFSEPIYLNGNIKDGNGVFAICRSTNKIITLSPFD